MNRKFNDYQIGTYIIYSAYDLIENEFNVSIKRDATLEINKHLLNLYHYIVKEYNENDTNFT